MYNGHFSQQQQITKEAVITKATSTTETAIIIPNLKNELIIQKYCSYKEEIIEKMIGL